MTLREAAVFLRCHTSTLYRMAKAHKVPYFRLGSDYRFSKPALELWMRNTMVEVSDEAAD